MNKKTQLSPLPPESLYRVCDPDDFDFQTTDELADIDLVVGQQRAIDDTDIVWIIDHGNVLALVQSNEIHLEFIARDNLLICFCIELVDGPFAAFGTSINSYNNGLCPIPVFQQR